MIFNWLFKVRKELYPTVDELYIEWRKENPHSLLEGFEFELAYWHNYKRWKAWDHTIQIKDAIK